MKTEIKIITLNKLGEKPKHVRPDNWKDMTTQEVQDRIEGVMSDIVEITKQISIHDKHIRKVKNSQEAYNRMQSNKMKYLHQLQGLLTF